MSGVSFAVVVEIPAMSDGVQYTDQLVVATHSGWVRSQGVVFDDRGDPAH